MSGDKRERGGVTIVLSHHRAIAPSCYRTMRGGQRGWWVFVFASNDPELIKHAKPLFFLCQASARYSAPARLVVIRQ